MNIPLSEIKYADFKDSETQYRRHLTVPYCMGNGLDLGSAGIPVVPWAIQVEADTGYHNGQGINYVGSATDLPFKDNTMDFVYSSHLLEDFFDWKPILDEWNRVLKPGGHFVIMLPDKALYRKAVENGQSDNPSHQHESYPGELTQFFKDNYPNMFEVIYDAVTDSYNILFIAKKL